ncbi:MAG: hypothetical protein VX642_08665 [Bdellovibrionota bacterium]|nr:hypothetical protein [Bdellovibrionota bacterium]
MTKKLLLLLFVGLAMLNSPSFAFANEDEEVEITSEEQSEDSGVWHGGEEESEGSDEEAE